MSKAFVYARGSTAKQHLTMNVQAERAEAYYKARLANCEWGGIFPDKATSGGKPLCQRQGGQGLLCSIQDGDHIVVTDLDRLFRSMGEAIETIQEWRDRNITLHLMEKGMTINDEVGMLLIAVLSWAAEYERKMAIDRTKRVIVNTRKDYRIVFDADHVYSGQYVVDHGIMIGRPGAPAKGWRAWKKNTRKEKLKGLQRCIIDRSIMTAIVYIYDELHRVEADVIGWILHLKQRRFGGREWGTRSSHRACDQERAIREFEKKHNIPPLEISSAWRCANLDSTTPLIATR